MLSQLRRVFGTIDHRPASRKQCRTASIEEALQTCKSALPEPLRFLYFTICFPSGTPSQLMIAGKTLTMHELAAAT